MFTSKLNNTQNFWRSLLDLRTFKFNWFKFIINDDIEWKQLMHFIFRGLYWFGTKQYTVFHQIVRQETWKDNNAKVFEFANFNCILTAIAIVTGKGESAKLSSILKVKKKNKSYMLLLNFVSRIDSDIIFNW